MTEPLDAQREHILSLIDDAGLAVHRADLERLIRPSVVLHTTRIEGAVPVGISRIGGAPELPAGTPWPHYEDFPLAFLAQLDLAEVARCLPGNPLPARGMLSLFAAASPDCDAYGEASAVLYTAADAARIVVPAPDSVDVLGGPRYACGVALRPELCLPSPGAPWLDAYGLDESAPNSRTYWEAVWAKLPGRDDDTGHRLLGYPDMEFCAHMADGDLLLQLAYDDAAELEFGDAQPLRFIMPRGAIERRAWDEAFVNGDEE